MDLRASSEQEQLRDSLRRLLDRRLTELVTALPEPPRRDRAQALADARAVGLLALALPEAVGGVGRFGDLVVAHEELGRALAPTLLTTLTLAGRLLLRATGPERDGLLTDLAAGELTAAPAVEEGPEPGGRTDTTVTISGDEARVEGRKVRVVDGQDVDTLLVSARDTTSGAIAVVGVPQDTDGMTLSRERSDTDATVFSVELSAVTVPASRVLSVGEDGLASYRIEATVLAAARQLGGGRAVLERTIDHVRTREQFDRPIGTFQAVQHQLADVATDVDAAALAVAQAAWSLDAGGPADQTQRLAAIAGLAAGAAFRRATLVAHQLHGGMGFVLDSPLHLWSARAVGDPTTPLARRHLLDQLAAASGITDAGVAVPADHRAGAQS